MVPANPIHRSVPFPCDKTFYGLLHVIRKAGFEIPECDLMQGRVTVRVGPPTKKYFVIRIGRVDETHTTVRIESGPQEDFDAILQGLTSYLNSAD